MHVLPLHLLHRQFEKLKAWQAAQEREAAVRPEAKRWIDPALVERCAALVVSCEPEQRQHWHDANTALAAGAVISVAAACVRRYAQEAEAAAAAEDERRKAAIKSSIHALAASLDEQVKLHESLKHEHDGEEQVRAATGTHCRLKRAAGMRARMRACLCTDCCCCFRMLAAVPTRQTLQRCTRAWRRSGRAVRRRKPPRRPRRRRLRRRWRRR